MALPTIPLNLPIDPRLAAQQEEELRRRQSMADANERATMQMLETMQRQNDPRAIQQQQNFERGMAEITARDRLRIDPDVVRAGEAAPGRLYGGQVQAPPGNKNPFLRGLSQLGRRTMDAFADPVANAQIVSALNTLRFKPDPNLARAAQARAESVQASRQEARQGNMTAQYLRQIGKSELADLVEMDPSLASDVIATTFGKGGVADKFFAPKTDPVTGAEYVTRVDPNTGEVEIVLTGGKQLTPQEKFTLEQQVRTEASDFNEAQKVGVAAMKSYDQIQQDINNLEQALSAVKSRPQITGPLAQFLPNITAEAAAFERAANQLGLGVVSGTTFGALSQSELALALRTNIDAGLPAPEQIKQLENIIMLRKKMAEAMYRKARELAAGDMKYSDYIKSQRPDNATQLGAPVLSPITSSTVSPPPLSSSASSYLNP
jgi:hypothetical protein